MDSLLTAFLPHAVLDEKSFFGMIEHRFAHAGFSNLASHPFAPFVFQRFAGSSPAVDWAAAGVAVNYVEKFLESEFTDITKSMYPTLFLNVESGPQGTYWSEEHGGFLAEDERATGVIEPATWKAFCERADVDEIFSRYDVDGDGVLCAGEALMMHLTTKLIIVAFTDISKGESTINAKQCAKCLSMLGLGQVPALHQNHLFAKVNTTSSGAVDVFELVQGCCRMLRPVTLQTAVQRIEGYPGWSCFQRQGLTVNSSPQDLQAVWTGLRDQADELQTGDILLMSLTDGTSRYMSFGMETMWTHAAIVVRHEMGPARLGNPNLETEYLLNDHPFRWGTHRFCNPRYCRCFTTSSAKQSIESMKMPISATECLEASGQGVHIYNLSARLFCGFNATRTGTVAVRRLKKAPGRDHMAKVEEFVSSVRGRLYSVGNDDGLRSLTCSELAAAFYQHMGWLAPGSKAFHEYSPSDFANGIVGLVAGAEWGDLQLVRDKWTNAPLPLPMPSIAPKSLTGGSRVSQSRL